MQRRMKVFGLVCVVVVVFATGIAHAQQRRGFFGRTASALRVAAVPEVAKELELTDKQAELAKHELLVLWTDYFKPEHAKKYKTLHETFWKAAKLCSACKQEVSLRHAEQLMKMVQKIHELFWKTKNRKVKWYLAS